jgi:hypothetical protein
MARPITFVIRSSTQEESNIGSVWIGGPACNFKERRLIIIWLPKRWWRPLFVDARRLDWNFKERYNDDPKRLQDATKGRVPIPWAERRPTFNTIVMSEWYREALGIQRSTGRDNRAHRAKLGHCSVCWLVGWFGWLRAGCQSPDPVARFATRLGVLGAWLGLLGLGDPAQKLCNIWSSCNASYLSLMARLGIAEGHIDDFRSSLTLVASLVIGIILWICCLGRPRPR